MHFTQEFLIAVLFWQSNLGKAWSAKKSSKGRFSILVPIIIVI
jgi:hypothetical protein